MDNPEDNYQFEFHAKKPENDKKHWWFKVGDILELKSVVNYTRKHKLGDEESELLETLNKAFHDKQLISFFEETEKNLNKVLNIFIRVNSGGVKLSYSDLLMSILTASFSSDIRERMLSIGQASKLLGVTIQTLRNWDKKDLLKPDELTKGGERRYKLESLRRINRSVVFNQDELKTIAYARVSSHDQQDDLIRQVQVLELYCAKCGFNYEVIQDLGSGMNYYKKGLTKLLNLILDNQVKRLVLTHKDRLLRFGAELVFSICEAKEVEVVIINKGDENVRFEEELAKDVLEIIARL